MCALKCVTKTTNSNNTIMIIIRLQHALRIKICKKQNTNGINDFCLFQIKFKLCTSE